MKYSTSSVLMVCLFSFPAFGIDPSLFSTADNIKDTYFISVERVAVFAEDFETAYVGDAPQPQVLPLHPMTLSSEQHSKQVQAPSSRVMFANHRGGRLRGLGGKLRGLGGMLFGFLRGGC